MVLFTQNYRGKATQNRPYRKRDPTIRLNAELNAHSDRDSRKKKPRRNPNVPRGERFKLTEYTVLSGLFYSRTDDVEHRSLPLHHILRDQQFLHLLLSG